MNTTICMFISSVAVLAAFSPAFSSAALPAEPICNMSYAPVCGQKYESWGLNQKDYSNACFMAADGATFLYNGRCNGTVTPPQPYPTPYPTPYPYPVPYPVQPVTPFGIHSFSGPTQLTVNKTGTWTVGVTDSSGYVTYEIDWDDQDDIRAASNASTGRREVRNNTTFTHSYRYAGTYTISIYAYDAHGRTSHATTTVRVTNKKQQYYPQYYDYHQPQYYYDDYGHDDTAWDWDWNYYQDAYSQPYNNYYSDYSSSGWYPFQTSTWM